MACVLVAQGEIGAASRYLNPVRGESAPEAEVAVQVEHDEPLRRVQLPDDESPRPREPVDVLVENGLLPRRRIDESEPGILVTLDRAVRAPRDHVVPAGHDEAALADPSCDPDRSLAQVPSASVGHRLRLSLDGRELMAGDGERLELDLGDRAVTRDDERAVRRRVDREPGRAK